MREPVSPADSSKRARTEAIEAGLLLVVERVVEIYQCRAYRIQHLQHRLKPPLHLGESSCWRQDRFIRTGLLQNISRRNGRLFKRDKQHLLRIAKMQHAVYRR